MTTKMIRVDASHEGLLDSFIDENSEYMEIVEDHNMAYDAYFYERKEQLSQAMDAIDNGRMKLLSEDEFSGKMKELESKLILHNGN
jgi:uncharacterized protein (UPF0262 family)